MLGLQLIHVSNRGSCVVAFTFVDNKKLEAVVTQQAKPKTNLVAMFTLLALNEGNPSVFGVEMRKVFLKYPAHMLP